jgi:GPH family glycoside/pentoside/hexuronide:cation symporter
LPIVFLQGTDSSIPLWQLLMIILAIACGAAMYGSSYFLTENRWAQREETLGFFASIKESIKNKPFLVFEAMNFAMQASQTVLFSGLLYIFTFVIHIQFFPDIFYFVPVIGILIFVIFLFNKYLNRIGIKHLFMYGCAIGALGFGLLPFFGRTLASQFIPITLIMIWLASYLLTGSPLMGDVIDHDELLTGKRRETTYAGVNALITKPSISIANWLFLGILGIYGFVQSEPGQPAPVQPASLGDGVVLAFSVIPVICLVISIVVMKFFSLDGPEWAAKKRAIRETHIQKEKDFVETLRREGKI